jgi:predicted NUDIX family NTP pyrophosphohydrolase
MICVDKVKSRRSRVSAGLLMFRRRNNEIKVLLVASRAGPSLSVKTTEFGQSQKAKTNLGEASLF